MKTNTKDWIAYLLRLIIGFWCGIIGWAGGFTLIGFGLYQLSKNDSLNISYGMGFLISIVVGGLIGGFPLAVLGVDWAARKWPASTDFKEMNSTRQLAGC